VKAALLTAAFLFALIATGLIFGWDIGVLGDPAWREDAHGWLAAAVAALALAFHPLIDRFDRRY
jgi:hypothetical protein